MERDKIKETIAIALIVAGLVVGRAFMGRHVWIAAAGWLAFALGVVATIVWIRGSMRRDAREGVRRVVAEELFKRNAVQRITVDLADCEVLSGTDYVEVPRHDSPRIQATDALYDELSGSDRSVERIEVNRSRLRWRDPQTGDVYVSRQIFTDAATLKFKMYDAKQTTIYIDAVGNYLFDLVFTGR